MSNIFTDINGIAWPIVIDVPAARRLKDQFNRDLLDRECLAQALSNPIAIVETVTALLESRRKERNLSETDLMDLLTYDDAAFLQTKKAFETALKAFFRRVGEVGLAEVLDKLTQNMTETREKMLTKMRSDKRIDEVFAKTAEKVLSDWDAELDAELAKLNESAEKRKEQLTKPGT